MSKTLTIQLDRVAETHYFIRPILVMALKNQILTDDARKEVGNFETYADFWEAKYSHRFFDMTTMIHLGSAIERCLKEYYMSKKGHKNISELQKDRAYNQGIFQRVLPAKNHNDVINLYRSQLGYDLTSNPHLLAVQEAMTHRHIYAHSSGLLDSKYIEEIKQITGNDLLALPEIYNSYPNDDTYWFEPLKRINFFIEASRNFFNQFP